MAGRTFALWIGLALLATGARVLAFEAAGPVDLLGDENYYVEVADNLARGRGHLYTGALEGEARAWRPPGHAWFLSIFVDPAEAAESQHRSDALTRRLQRSQIALGVLVVLLTAALARALFDDRTAVLAGGIAALYPALIAHSHYLWSETSFATLLLCALLAVVHSRGTPRWQDVAVSGLLFGLCALVRELALLAASACALWWAWRARFERTSLVRAGAMLALAVAVTSPWMLRNHTTLGRFVGLSTVGWFAVAEGNSLETPAWWERRGSEQARFHADYFSKRDEIQRLDIARSHGLARIAAEQPLWLPRKAVRNLALLLNPDAVLRTKVRNGAYGDQPSRLTGWLLAASAPSWLVLATLATLGVAASRNGDRRLLALLLLGGAAALHVAANATPRFRVPWLPLLCIYAGHALSLGRSVFAGIDRRGAIGAGAALAFLFGVALPYYWMFGGRP